MDDFLNYSSANQASVTGRDLSIPLFTRETSPQFFANTFKVFDIRTRSISHATLKEVERYTKAAKQAHMARAAMVRLSPLSSGRFERPGTTERTPAPAWRYVLGALMMCGGLALLAAQGVGGYGQFGLNVWGLALAFAGIGLIARRAGVPRAGSFAKEGTQPKRRSS
jgi:hypothetical protein